MTNFNDIATYRMEKDPESVRRDTLDLLDQGVSGSDLEWALMSSAAIEAGHQMLRRLADREQAKRDCNAFFAKRAA